MRMLRTIFYISLILISPEVLAGVFTAAPTDESIRLLGIIFGPNVGSIALNTTSGTSMLPSLMEKLNFIVVTVGGLILAKVAVQSIINTGHEGSMMGKSWSMIWVPMRTLIGLALMVPAPSSGYSMIQVFVMWIVMQSIGAADQLWNVALDSLSSGVSAAPSQITATNAPTIQELTVKTLVKDPLVEILSAQICMQTFNKMAADKQNQTSPYFGLTAKAYAQADTTNNPKLTPLGAQATGTMYFGVAGNSTYAAICGQINLSPTVYNVSSCQNTTTYNSNNCDYPPGVVIQSQQLQNDAETLYQTMVNAIQLVLNTWSQIADAYVQNDSANQNTTSSTIPAPSIGAPVPPGYYLNAKNALIGALEAAVVPGYSAPTGASGGSIGTTGQSSQIQTAIQAGKDNGWVAAGSYYFVFNQSMTSKIFNDASTFPNSMQTFNIPICDELCYNNVYGNGNASVYNPGNGTDYAGNYSVNAFSTTPGNIGAMFATSPTNYVNLLSKYLAWGDQYSLNDANTTAPSSAMSGVGGGSSSAANDSLSSISNAGTAIINSLNDTLNGITNGTDPLMALQILGHKTMIACEIVWAGLLVANFILSIAASLSTMVEVFIAAFGLLAFISGICVTFWSLGAMLAIYMPLIPTIIFITTVVGWMLLVIEAVFAAPLLALGIVIPSQDDMGRLGHGLMLLANIFLRPMLMILGFILAGRVFAAIVTLISFGMADVFKTINTFTLFSSVVIFFMYCSFIISVANTSFSLIYALPDKVLRWIGGGGEGVGQQVADTLHQMKQGAQSAAQMAARDAGGAADFLNNRWSKQLNKRLEERSRTRARNDFATKDAADLIKKGKDFSEVAKELKNKGYSTAEIAQALNRNGAKADEAITGLRGIGLNRNDTTAALNGAGYSATDLGKAYQSLASQQAADLKAGGKSVKDIADTLTRNEYTLAETARGLDANGTGLKEIAKGMIDAGNTRTNVADALKQSGFNDHNVNLAFRKIDEDAAHARGRSAAGDAAAEARRRALRRRLDGDDSGGSAP